MPESSINDLFAAALQGDYDNDEAWQAVHTLRSLGTRDIFDQAVVLCRSPEPLKRARGADILGQLGKTSESPITQFPNESFKVLTGMLDSETDRIALSAIIAALGHLENPAAIPMILPFSYHPDPDVRFGLAFALGCLAGDRRTVSTLLKLMTDKDDEVRDWATFGLGVLGDFDSTEIREALFQNLSDGDEEIRGDAMEGLAKRHDLRVLPHVMDALEDDEPIPEALEAANFLLDRRSDRLEDASEILEALRQRFPTQDRL